MKFLAIALSFWTISAMAKPCASIYVFKPFKSCETAANGVDEKRCETIVPVHHSVVINQRGTAETACKKVAEGEDTNGPTSATRGRSRGGYLASTNDGNAKINVTYDFGCYTETVRCAYLNKPNRACGSDGAAMQQEPASKGRPQEDAICLSADDVTKVPDAIKQLKSNYDEVVAPGNVISIRDEDKQAMLNRVTDLLEQEAVIQNADDIRTLLDLQKALKK